MTFEPIVPVGSEWRGLSGNVLVVREVLDDGRGRNKEDGDG